MRYFTKDMVDQLKMGKEVEAAQDELVKVTIGVGRGKLVMSRDYAPPCDSPHDSTSLWLLTRFNLALVT